MKMKEITSNTENELNSTETATLTMGILKRWKEQMRWNMIIGIIKVIVRILIWMAVIVITFVNPFAAPKMYCLNHWISDSPSYANENYSLNVVPCERVYDVYDQSSESFDFLKDEKCATKVTLTIDSEHCYGLSGNVIKGPVSLFTDIKTLSIPACIFDIGDNRLDHLIDYDVKGNEHCRKNEHYVYPCGRSMMSIYNDSITITDATGLVIDTSTDLLPMFHPADIETPSNPAADDDIYQWMPEVIFPGKLENARAKTWFAFGDHYVIEPTLSKRGVEPLPIGTTLEDLTLPLTIDITDRWSNPQIMDEYAKTFRITTPSPSNSEFIWFVMLSVAILIILEVITAVGYLVKIRSLGHITHKDQVPQWILAIQDPISDIIKFRTGTGEAFKKGTDDMPEAYRRVSVADVTRRRRGSGFTVLRDTDTK